VCANGRARRLRRVSIEGGDYGGRKGIGNSARPCVSLRTLASGQWWLRTHLGLLRFPYPASAAYSRQREQVISNEAETSGVRFGPLVWCIVDNCGDGSRRRLDEATEAEPSFGRDLMRIPPQ
jgi:hypothetical protein